MPVTRDNPQGADWARMERQRRTLPEFVSVELQPLDKYGVKSPLHQLKRELGISGGHARSDGPMLMLSEPYWVEFGAEAEKDGQWALGVPLLTSTAKMGCMSMSLPAGPSESLGTCPLAQKETTQALADRIRADDPDPFKQELRLQFQAAPPTQIRDRRGNVVGEGPPAYICDGCYAGKGNYAGFRLNIIKASWRLAWVNAALAARHGFFVAQMKKAINHFYTMDRLPDGINGKYFRWHDAGDVWNATYWKAIVQIAREMPHITFWMPTRQWASPAWAELFRAPLPRNLIVRPSALFVDGPGPMLAEDSGLAAGTMVTNGPVGSLRPHRQEEGRPFAGPAQGVFVDPRAHKGPRLFPERRIVRVGQQEAGIFGSEDLEVWDCPAYLGDSEATRSCQAQKCRVCWTRPDVVVAYNNH